MRDLQSQLATKLNAHWGRKGTFFEHRYASSWVLDDDAHFQQFCRTICLPCEDDVVAHPDDWTGVSSWDFHKSGSVFSAHRTRRKVFSAADGVSNWVVHRIRGFRSAEACLEHTAQTRAPDRLLRVQRRDPTPFRQRTRPSHGSIPRGHRQGTSPQSRSRLSIRYHPTFSTNRGQKPLGGGNG